VHPSLRVSAQLPTPCVDAGMTEAGPGRARMCHAEEMVDIFVPLSHGPDEVVELGGLRSNSLAADNAPP
jgi:hypothetical protein